MPALLTEREPRRRRWLAWLRRSTSAPALPRSDPDSEPDGLAEGLRQVRAPADHWFDQQVAELEAAAVELAHAAAAAGLPRTDVAYERVPEEEALATRAGAVFRGWVERVRTRVQDAIQNCTRRADAHLSAYEHELVELELGGSRMKAAAAALERAETETTAGYTTLEVRRYFAPWKYRLLIGMLVLVDWVANVPVFAELLPKDPGAEAAWRQIAADSEQYGPLGGLYRAAARAAHHPDASVLALGVIIFLVFLAHVFGEAVRRRTSLDEAETPSAATTIRGHRRQFGFAALASSIGIVAVLGFLWLARYQLERSTSEQVAEAQAQVTEIQEQLAAARAAEDLVAIGEAEQRLDDAQHMLAQRIDRADYADVIARMNWPILLLNFVLAVAAALAAYLATRDSLHGRLDSPRAAELRRELRALRHGEARRREALARLDVAIRREFAAANYLLHSRPLQGWEAKLDRLRAVIPRFRVENARARGIDTANIAAFQKPVALAAAPGEEDAMLTAPAELIQQQERLEALRARAALLLGLRAGGERQAADPDPDPARAA
jgi:hypothetical protein